MAQIRERAIRLSVTRRMTRAAHIHVALTLEARRSPPAGFFVAPTPGEYLGRFAPDDRGRRFGGILGVRDCAVFATIGLTGVKRLAIGYSPFRNSIRARRTSDICFRTPSHASIETTTREWARHGWVRERTRLIRQRGGCRSGRRNLPNSYESKHASYAARHLFFYRNVYRSVGALRCSLSTKSSSRSRTIQRRDRLDFAACWPTSRNKNSSG